MKNAGYDVENTTGENLDIDFKIVSDSEADIVTEFYIFEHMLAPFNLLNSVKNKSLSPLFLLNFGLLMHIGMKMMIGINIIMNLNQNNLNFY